MGQFSVDVMDAIVKLRAQRDRLDSLAAPVQSFDWARRSEASLQAPFSIAQRYGDLAAEAAIASPAGRDFICLGIIDWAYRIQRPQHLSTHLADLGNRVIYISIVFGAADADGRFEVLSSPHPGVFEVRLRLVGDVPAGIYRGFNTAQVSAIDEALDEVRTVLGIRAPVVIVEYPSWSPVAFAVPGATVLYDCLDYLGGFANVPHQMLELEQQLIERADIVIASSKPIADDLAPQRSSVIVRNAADVDFFSKGTMRGAKRNAGPVIGYFGAIAEWFEVDWIVSSARTHSDWHFHIIGEVSGADISEALTLPNITFLGETPYRDLPSCLSEFDVAIIPFKLSKLIECVNPVKLYEYMSQGKPVVSSPMPEVIGATELVYIANDAADFERQVTRALSEDTPELRERRRAWAMNHTWAHRAAALEQTVKEATPRVSVIVLSYNNLALTRACLHSVLTLSDYPNLEVIVVDNASNDRTPQFLEALSQGDARVRIILNEENHGFAAGNNMGLREATGDYLVLLNNDTYVTRGWLRDLIRPLMLDPSVGLVGPLTNNIGNEQKISLSYSSMSEMATMARDFTGARSRRRLSVQCIAFFCAAMRRNVLDSVGFLDEAYGIGFFEDDDYSKRVLAAGYSIVVADDVFIHHELSASFRKLTSDTTKALMKKNQALFEKRWGPWKAHRYRDEPGFGA